MQHLCFFIVSISTNISPPVRQGASFGITYPQIFVTEFAATLAIYPSKLTGRLR